MINLTQCIKCVHREHGKLCLAYPKGIPFKVFTGEIPHNQIFEDQVDDYVYTPKEKYLRHDLEAKTVYYLSSDSIKNLEDDIAQLFLDNLSSWEITMNGWDSVRLDFELLNNHSVRINEFLVFLKGEMLTADKIANPLLWEKLVALLRIQKSRLGSRRLKVTLWPDRSTEFEYTSLSVG
ncbi:hypothetical protein [Lewinella sp. LCG006]|uniref:hypothetical protein n=1 Tax=Lewinella sp. LCG006 TaxID=3231911 RepID=UPI003460D3B8